jgi:hypothetical protein
VCYYYAIAFHGSNHTNGFVTDNSALTAAMKKPSPHRNLAEIKSDNLYKDNCSRRRNKLPGLSFHNDAKYSFTVTNVHAEKKEIPVVRRAGFGGDPTS